MSFTQSLLLILCAVNFFTLVTACWQAIEARDIKCEFAEAKWIGLAVFSMAQGFLTGIPIVAVARDIPEAFYLILTFLIFVICMVVLTLIFLPKILMQRRYGLMTPAEQKRSMAISVRQSAGVERSSISGLSGSTGASAYMRKANRPSLPNREAQVEQATNSGQATSGGGTSSGNSSNPAVVSRTSKTTDDGIQVAPAAAGTLVSRLDDLNGEPTILASYIEDDDLMPSGATPRPGTPSPATSVAEA